MGRSPSLRAVATCPLQAFRIEIEARLLDVREDRRRADKRRHLGGRGEGEARADHRVARPDPLGHQHQHQRVGAARATHRMARAAERGQRGFESAHLGSENELAMAEHARDRLVDGSPEATALRGNVDERNRRGIEAGALIHRGHRIDRAGKADRRQPVSRRGPARRRATLGSARLSRQRMAISRLATPSSPVTAGSLPLRIAPTKACSSARNGSA